MNKNNFKKIEKFCFCQFRLRKNEVTTWIWIWNDIHNGFHVIDSIYKGKFICGDYIWYGDDVCESKRFE